MDNDKVGDGRDVKRLSWIIVQIIYYLYPDFSAPLDLSEIQHRLEVNHVRLLELLALVRIPGKPIFLVVFSTNIVLFTPSFVRKPLQFMPVHYRY